MADALERLLFAAQLQGGSAIAHSTNFKQVQWVTDHGQGRHLVHVAGLAVTRDWVAQGVQVHQAGGLSKSDWASAMVVRTALQRLASSASNFQ